MSSKFLLVWLLDPEGCMSKFIKSKKFQSGGHHSVVSLGSVDECMAIRKKIGYEISYSELKKWLSRSITYRKRVEDLGFGTPRNFYTELVNNKDCSYLEIIDEYLGKNTFGDLSTGNLFIAWTDLIGKLILNFNSVEHPVRVGVMLDLKPENLIFHNNTLYCIDFFPPILSNELGEIDFFDEKIFKNKRHILEFVFGDIRGQITRMLFRIKDDYDYTTHCQLKKITKALIKDRLSIIAEEYIEEQIDSDLPHMKLLYSTNMSAIDNFFESMKIA